MEFRTQHHFSPIDKAIRYEDQIVSIGSCFAENMGKQLLAHKMKCLANPNGILFNPISILNALKTYLSPSRFEPNNAVFEYQGIYHSWLHHGAFNTGNKTALIEKITRINNTAHTQLCSANYLIITWGSAFVYEHIESNTLVANCHKIPAKEFRKRLLSVSEIVHAYQDFLKELYTINPGIKIIWSISPVKYIKDGLNQNNLSKSTLFLALQELLQSDPNSYYFPAFELVQDELRDYRFYAKDMAHPNEQALAYVWEKFTEHCLDKSEHKIRERLSQILLDQQHKILHPDDPAYLKFKTQLEEKILQFKKEFPGISI